MIDLKIDLEKYEDLDPKDIEEGLAEALKTASTLISNEAKSNHRYRSRSGNLKRATKTKSTKESIQAYIDEAMARYGKYIHNGSRSWAPDEFVEDAIKNNLDKIDRLIADSIDKKLE